ncbi:MAG: anthranilate phosphoribosyltransferase [Firmicutes bacterium]|nr:anthranilate phosphoribosyltransferase [Bacillota bacterium]
MKEILLSLSRGQDLTEEQARMMMERMMNGSATAVETTAYLTLLAQKGETVQEIYGSASAMRRFSVSLQTSGVILDTCGTGGDHSGSFNISTAAAIVAAAGGCKVAKHGNRAASSQTGSADVLAALGVPLDLTPEQSSACLEDVGFCFLFAQSYHPAMKHVAPIRRELGYRTVFNMLGPLTNPARPDVQVIGAPSPDIAHKLAHALALLGTRHALVVHSQDGLDELSVSAPTRVYEVLNDRVRTFDTSPAEVGLSIYGPEQIKGGDAAYNADLIRSIFHGRRGAPREIVAFNAGAALYVCDKAQDLRDGVQMACELIDSGAAADALDRIAHRHAREAVSA